MRDLVNEDVKSWAADLFSAAVATLKASRSPPTDFPDVVVPVWAKFNGNIAAGGLQHAPNVSVSGLKASGVKRAAPAGAAGSRGPCWAWSKPEGCSFGKAYVYSHSPAKKYRAGDGGSGSGSNSGGGSGGSIPRRGGSGSGGGTSSGGSSARAGAGTRSGVRFQPLPRLLPVLDEDAGSVCRWGQPSSPRGAYPRGGFMRENGRGRRCNLSQVWLRVCGSVWLPLMVRQRSKGVGGLSRR